MPEIRSIPRTIWWPACLKCSTLMNLWRAFMPDEEGTKDLDSSPGVRIAVPRKLGLQIGEGDVFRSEHFCSRVCCAIGSVCTMALHLLNRAYLKRKAS